MLEKQLSAILAEHLRAFIENVNEEQLRISLWAGDLVLHNLTLRPDILDQVIKLVIANSDVEGGSETTAAAAKALLLPFTVVQGVVKTLRISVPWTALQGEPVSIELDGIELILGPLRGRPYSRDEEVNRSGAIQAKQLQQFNRFRLTLEEHGHDDSNGKANTNTAQSHGTTPTTTGAASKTSSATPLPVDGSPTLSTTLITTIARNAHLVLRNICCRYLHDYPGLHPSLASMVELSIAEIFVTTTDDAWRARFVSDPSMPICKEVSVEGLSVTLYHGKALLPATESSNSNTAGGHRESQDASHTPSARVAWQSSTTLVRGGDMTVRIRMPAPSPVTPSTSSATGAATDVFVQMNPLELHVCFDSIKHLSIIAEAFAPRYVDCSQFRTFLHILDRGLQSVGGGSRRAVSQSRWQFAYVAVKHLVALRRAVLQSSGHGGLWRETKTFCDIRREYVSLFKRFQQVRWLPPLKSDEMKRLELLETQLRVDQVIFMQCLARAELAFEKRVEERQRSLISNIEGSLAQQRNKNANRSRWTSWMYRGSVDPQIPLSDAGSSGPLTDPVNVGFQAGEEKRIVLASFDIEWAKAQEYLSLGSRSALKVKGPAPSTMNGGPSTALSTDKPQRVRVHLELSALSLRVSPTYNHHNVDGRDRASSGGSVLALHMVQALQQEVVVAFMDISTEIVLGCTEVRHAISVDIGRCEGYLETNVDRDGRPSSSARRMPLLSANVSHPASGPLVDVTSSSRLDESEPSSPSQTSWLSIGLTNDHHLDVLMQPTAVHLHPFHEGTWWPAALATVMADVAAVLPMGSGASSELLLLPAAATTAPPTPSAPPSVGPPSKGLRVNVVARHIALTLHFGDVEEDGAALHVALHKLGMTQSTSGDSSISVGSIVASHGDGDDAVTLLRFSELTATASPNVVEVAHTGEIEALLHAPSIQRIGDAMRGVSALNHLSSHSDASIRRQLEDLVRDDTDGVVAVEASTCTLQFLSGTNVPLHWRNVEDLRQLLTLAWLRRALPDPSAPLANEMSPKKRQPSTTVTSSLWLRVGSVHLEIPSLRPNEAQAVLTLASSSTRAESPLTLRISTSADHKLSKSTVELRHLSVLLSRPPTTAYPVGMNILAFPTMDVLVDVSTTRDTLTSTTVDMRCRQMGEVSMCTSLVSTLETIMGVSSTFSTSIVTPLRVGPPAKPIAADVAFKCRMDEGLHVELYVAGSAASRSQDQDVVDTEALAEHLFRDTLTPVNSETSICIIELETLSISMVDTAIEQRIVMEGILGCLQQVSPITAGELLAVMGPGTSKTDYAKQRFDITVVTPRYPASTTTRGDGADVTHQLLPPTMRLQASLRGGKMCYYHAFFMTLANYGVYDTTVVRLSNCASSSAATIGVTGLTAASSTSKDGVCFAAVKSFVPPPPPDASAWTEVEVSADALEVLLATNAHEPVIEEVPTSYVRMVLDHVDVETRQLLHSSDAHPYIRTSVRVSRILMSQDDQAERPEMYELMGGIQVNLSSNVLCIYRAAENRYEYQWTPSPLNTTTHVSFQHHRATGDASSTEGEGVQAGPSRGIDITLTTAQYTSLMQVVFQNFLLPDPRAELPATTQGTDTPQAGTPAPINITMVSIPSIRCVVATASHRLFALRLTGGMRMYQIAGGKLTIPQTAIDLCGIVVEECSSMFKVVDRALPRDKQTPPFRPSLKPLKLLMVERLPIRMQGDDVGLKQTIEVHGVQVQPMVESLMALRDALLNEEVSQLLAPAPSSNPPAPTTSPSRLSVDVYKCVVSFVEPWGEVLGELVMDHVQMGIVGHVDGSQDVTIVVPGAITLRHTFLDNVQDAPYRYQCLFAAPKANPKEDNVDGAPAVPPAVSMKLHTPPVASTAAATPCHPGVARREQPQASTDSEVDISLSGFSFVVLPTPLLRLINYVSGELMDVAYVSYDERTRRSLRTTSSFGFSKLRMSAVNSKVLVPCSIVAAARDSVEIPVPSSADLWEFTTRAIEVQNRQFVSTSTVKLRRAARLSAHDTLECTIDEYEVNLSGISGMHSLHPSLPPLLQIERVRIVVESPTPMTTVVESRTSVAVARSDHVATSTSWTVLPFDDVEGACFTTSLRASIDGAHVLLSDAYVGASLRCLNVMGAAVETVPFYNVEAPFAFHQDTHVHAMNTRVGLVDGAHDDGVMDAVAQQQASTTAPSGGAASSNWVRHFNASTPFLTVWINHIAFEQRAMPRGDDASLLDQQRMSISVVDGATVSDANGNVILLRSMRDSILSTGAADHSPTVSVDIIPSDHQTLRRGITIETNDLSLVLQSFTVDAVVRMYDFIALVQLAMGSVASSTNTAQEKKPGADHHQHTSSTPPTALPMSLRLRGTSVCVADVAVATARSISMLLTDSGAQAAQPHPPSSPHAITMEGITLSRPGMPSDEGGAAPLEFVEVGTADIRIGAGDLQVRVLRVKLCNYNSAFFVDLLEAVQYLQEYFAINAKLPTQQEEGYRQSLLVSVRELQVSLFPGGASLKNAPRLDLVFPGFVIRHLGTSSTVETSIDSEDGSIVYHHPGVHASLYVCRGMSIALQLTSNAMAASSSTTLKLGSISVVVPIGTVLQNFVEVVATSLVPFSRVVLFPTTTANSNDVPSSSRRPQQAKHGSASIVLIAPHLSLHVCDATNVRAAINPPTHVPASAAASSRTLFGVDVHQLHFSHRIAADSDIVEVSITEITSVIDRSIQRAFITAQPLVVDGDVSPAILLRKETRAPTQRNDEQRDDTDAPSQHDAERCRRENIVIKLYDFDATISPSLLAMVNENILERVAIATKRVKASYVVPLSTTKTLPFATPRRSRAAVSSGGASGGGGLAAGAVGRGVQASPASGGGRRSSTTAAPAAPPGWSIITVSDCEHTVKQDIVIGGKNGPILHFSKHPLASAGSAAQQPPSTNTIRFAAPLGGVATVYVSLVEGVDGQVYLPIVIDDGLSVITESIRFVLPSSAASQLNESHRNILNYMSVGERSFFHVEPAMVILPQRSHRTTVASLSGADAADALASPSSAMRSARYLLHVDIFATIAVRFWSFHQAVAFSTEVSAKYSQQSSRREGSDLPRTIIDEQGDLTISNLNVVSDAGSITSQPTGVVLHVGYHKPSDADDTKEGARTYVRAIVPSTKFVISIGHVKLMYDIFRALRRGSEHLGSIELVATVVEEDGQDGAPVDGIMAALSPVAPVSSTTPTKSAAPSLQKRCPLVPAKVFSQRRVHRGGIGSSRLELGVTAPQVCVVLTNDFFHPMGVLSIDNVAVQGRLSRDVTDVKLSVSAEITVRDSPEGPLATSEIHPHDGSRLLVQAAPEAVIVYNAFDCGQDVGHAFQLAAAVADVQVTVPVQTLQRLMAYQFESQKTGAHAFLNSVGVPLVLVAAEAYGANTAESLPMCELPMDVVVKADIFRYDQTQFRLIAGSPQGILNGKAQRASALGQPVDLRLLHSGSTLGLMFLAAADMHPLYEVLMRLDSKERMVTLTTTVVFKNNLAASTIQLSSAEEQFAVEPGKEMYVPIPVLQHVMQLCVDGRWSLLDPLTAASFCQWDAFLGAFSAACEEPEPLDPQQEAPQAHAASFVRGVLSMPVTLRDDSETPSAPLCAMLSVERRPILNYKDADATMGTAAQHQQRSSASAVKYEVIASLSPVTRFLNRTGMTLQLTVHMPQREKQEIVIVPESGMDWFNEIHCAGGAVSGITAKVLDGSMVVLASNKVCPLPRSQDDDKWMVLLDDYKRETHLKVSRNSTTGFFHIQAAAVLTSRLPIPVELFTAGGAGSLLPGQYEGGAGIVASRDDDSATLLIGYPRSKEEPVAVRARLCRNGAKLSQPFQVTSLLPSSVLACDEAHLVHVFSARREVMETASPGPHQTSSLLAARALLHCPRIVLEPLWWVHNAHPSLMMFIRSAGLDEHVSTIPPLSRHPIVTFHTSCSADPAVQVCYSIEGRPSFEWSQPLPLATLTSGGSCRVLSHNARSGEDVMSHLGGHLGTPLYHCTPRASSGATPRSGGPTPNKVFACLRITSKRAPSGIVEVECQLGPAEVILENRTDHLVSYATAKNLSATSAYDLQPLSDAAVAWDGTSPTDTFTLKLEAMCGKRKRHSVSIELMAQSTTRDALKVADGLWVLTTFDTKRHVYHIAVVADRMLEGALISQPRTMVNLEFFCRHALIHVAASPIADVAKTSLDQLPFADAARRGDMWCLDDDALLDDARQGNARLRHHAQESRILHTLARTELDVVAVEVHSIYVNACSNGTHRFGEASVQSIVVHDCTVENPHFPVVFAIRGRSVNRLHQATQAEDHQPALLVQAHFGASSVVSYSGHEAVAAASIRKLLIHCEPIHVKLCDAFLSVTRMVAARILMPQQDGVAARNGGTSAAVAPSPATPMVRCYIERLCVHAIQLRLTLSRRSDGRYNPLDGLPIGVFVPSLEEAPIALGELVLADLTTTSDSIGGALIASIVPFYRSRIVFQLFKVLGSIEAIGNPMMLASDVSAGVRAFVKNTVDLHPWAGTKSLLQSTASGAFHSVALLSKVGGRTTAVLARDFDWLEHQEGDPLVVHGGVFWGLASGVANGITGVVRDPVRGLRDGGAAGFCAGILTGAIGVVSRPVSGVLGGLGNTAEIISTSLRPHDDESSEGPTLEDADAAGRRHLRFASRNFTPPSMLPSGGNGDFESTGSASNNLTPSGRSPRSGTNLLQSSAASMGGVQFMSRTKFFAVACASATSAPSEAERWRLLFHVLGAHNVARHAPWKEYHRYCTPNEFSDTCHLAVEGLLAKALIDLRTGELAKIARRKKRVPDDPAHRVRTLTIKASLGPKDTLKYVTLEQFVSVSCLSELKVCASPEDLQKKLAPLLKDHVERFVIDMLSATWE